MCLCPVDNFSLSPFIKKGEFGYLKHWPQILYGLIEFDDDSYTDELFYQLTQPFPEKLRQSVVRRKAEFLAGRYCCSSLLKIAGAQSTYVESENGVPVWPLGWHGSISHTDNYVIVVLANKKLGLTLGIDIEKNNPDVLLNVVDMFSSENERTLLRALPLPYNKALLLLFSAKESLFKSLWPETAGRIDFHVSSITSIDVIRQTFTLVLSSTLSSNFYAGKKITGRYNFLNEYVMTFIACGK